MSTSAVLVGPHARGELSAELLRLLVGSPAPAGHLSEAARSAVDTAGPDVFIDDDVQLSLYLCYELHYGGLPALDAGWEWQPDLLAARAVLEGALWEQLRERYDNGPGCAPEDLPARLFELAAGDSVPTAGGGRSVSGLVMKSATAEQVADLLVLRSPYQLKEADPHSWAIPRLRGRAKAALVEIQADEYGQGRVEQMHSTLFATTMRAFGLSTTPNAYLDQVPALALASVNTVSFFGLHQRLRGALVGHLTAFEMTSSLPSRRQAAGLRRLGLEDGAAEFYDVHVTADAVHEQVAAYDLCGSLVQDEPDLVGDVLLGARACLGLDDLVADLILTAWQTGGSPLRPIPEAALLG